MNELIDRAPKLSMRNRAALNIAAQCGCYSCMRGFNVTEIVKWTDNRETAICPHCGVDAIIADITDTALLTEINRRWFPKEERT